MGKKIVTAGELAEELACSKALIRQIWRDLPHFFVGRSTSMRGARFVVNDVVKHLEKRDATIKPSEPEKKLLTAQELKQELGISWSFLRKNWKALPHVCVNNSSNMGGVRFDVDDVVDFLKKQNAEED